MLYLTANVIFWHYVCRHGWFTYYSIFFLFVKRSFFMTILQLLHKWNFFTGISAHFWSNSVWNANTSGPVQFGAKLTKSEKIFTSTATLLFFFYGTFACTPYLRRTFRTYLFLMYLLNVISGFFTNDRGSEHIQALLTDSQSFGSVWICLAELRHV